MLKFYDENQKPVSLQRPIIEFMCLEKITGNYGLSPLIDRRSADR